MLMQAHLLASYTPGVTVDRMPVAYVLLHLLCSSTHVSLTSGQQILSHCYTFAARCLEDIHTQKRLLLFEGIVALQLTCTHARMHTRTQARTHARTNTHTHLSVLHNYQHDRYKAAWSNQVHHHFDPHRLSGSEIMQQTAV